MPCFIVDFTSASTWREDFYKKRRRYAKMGVREYFIYDPEALYLRPALQGWRLDERSVYVPLEPDADDRLKSEELGLYLRGEGTMLRLIDAATGKAVPTREERIEQERSRADRMEAEVIRLRALLEQAQGGQGPVAE